MLIVAVMAVGGVVLVFMGRGEDEGDDSPGQAKTTTGGTGIDSPANSPSNDPGSDSEPVRVPQLPESTCSPELTNCVVASGRVVYVEAVDPDGDGDAHFVTASGDSITGPGITIFDVKEELRPDPLPGIGDLVGGAGPVFPGSQGQKQIEVTEFHVAE